MVKRSPPIESVPDFTPVPRKCDRHDGWTPERQRGFIAALAELGSVSGACRRRGDGVFGRLCPAPRRGRGKLRAAWKQALDMGVQRLADIAVERAIEGVPVPIMYHGEQVGERRHYNDRLLTFMLQHHQPQTYGAYGSLRPGIRSARFDDLENEDESANSRGHGADLQQRAVTRSRRMLLSLLADDPGQARGVGGVGRPGRLGRRQAARGPGRRAVRRAGR